MQAKGRAAAEAQMEHEAAAASIQRVFREKVTSDVGNKVSHATSMTRDCHVTDTSLTRH